MTAVRRDVGRDRAMILLLARLGLRAGDVAGLLHRGYRVGGRHATGLRGRGATRFDCRSRRTLETRSWTISHAGLPPGNATTSSFRNICAMHPWPFKEGDGVSSAVKCAMRKRRAGIVEPSQRRTCPAAHSGDPDAAPWCSPRPDWLGPQATGASTRRRLLRQSRRQFAERDRAAMAGGTLMKDDAVAAYLALRRTAGFAMANAEYLCGQLCPICRRAEQTIHILSRQAAIDWAAQGTSVARRDERLRAVCRFARHVRVEDDRHELPPANYFGLPARHGACRTFIRPTKSVAFSKPPVDFPSSCGAIRAPTTVHHADRAAGRHRAACF